MLIDTHAHLDLPQFDPDRDEMINRASNENIVIIHSGLGVEGIGKAKELVKNYDNIYATLGLSPTEFSGEVICGTINEIRKNKDNPKIIGIGEVGLDYHWVKERELRNAEHENFKKFIELSSETKLPLVIHSRNAENDCVKILKEYDRGAIMHCFCGTIELALEAISFGCLISVTTTFMNSIYRKKMVQELPLEKLVLETDAPYLSPVQGKRNESINIKLTAGEIAKIKCVDFTTVAETTTRNAEKFFNVKFDTI